MNFTPQDLQPRSLQTDHGQIKFPAYIPVTTFGEKYPLDELIQPYLPRLCQAVMVSYHYAKQMKKRPRIPLLVDSGGFAALFAGSSVVEEGGLGLLRVAREGGDELLTPKDVLEFQELHADVAFTLDFPIPPGLDSVEATRRHALTIANGIWAIRNRRRHSMRLYASIQAWDKASAAESAAELASHPFDGFAIGGMVPRARNLDQVLEIVDAVLAEIGDRPLHVFGLGKPETTERLFAAGVDSVDSSSYVKLAADGRRWDRPDAQLNDPTTTDRLQLALLNLMTATKANVPMSFPPKNRRTLQVGLN